ncbi:hypothetical protein M8818_002088 [Zalaria obscura]|uniref:Uncharacterized protein n=1 Tax=Zalaria obscura TaxID=2024903 RepID=A0ACC3SJS9_9PEZI
MKLTAITSTLIILAPVAMASDISVCQSKSLQIVAAIEKFCSKTNMVVPSWYAHVGATVGDRSVWIEGAPHQTCNPPQWVPQEYCRSQLFHVCAGGTKEGFGYAYYGAGNSKCQVFTIQSKEYHGTQ